jgi:spore maturation protein CgeB
MTRPSVVLIAAFDDGPNAHGAQRGRALERLGCDVTAVNVIERRGPLGLFRSKDLPTRLEEAIREASPDVVLAIGAPELDNAVVESMQALTDARWINWFPNDMRTVDEAVALAPAYNEVWAAGTDVARHLSDALNRKVEVLPLACDPSVYRPVRARDQQYRANVVFAGAATNRREVLLSSLVEFGLAIWGPGWRRTSLRDYCRGEQLQTEEFVRAYGGASVAVNIHHTADGRGIREASCNQRMFEIASIGVLQVVDRRDDLGRWFEPGDELLVFDEGEQLRQIVEEALQDLAAAERIATAGRQRLLAEHTYMHRMQALLGRTLAAGE